MQASVVIPTKDRPALLADTLASLSRCAPAPAEVIVVDASEGDESAGVVAAAAQDAPDIAFRHLTGTRGACRQRNRGIDEATGDVIVFLDDDVLLEPGALGALLAPLEDASVVGVTGRTLEGSPRRLSLKHSSLRRLLPGAGRQGTFTACGYPNRLWEVERRHVVETLNGCFMVGRAADVRAVRFDERLEAPDGYALLDDEDFGLRLSRRGGLRYEPAAVLEHRNTGFSSSASRRFNRELVRNRWYTYRKSFRQTPVTRAQWWFYMGVHVVHRLLNADWAGARGLAEGLREVAAGRSR